MAQQILEYSTGYICPCGRAFTLEFVQVLSESGLPAFRLIIPAENYCECGIFLPQGIIQQIAEIVIGMSFGQRNVVVNLASKRIHYALAV